MNKFNLLFKKLISQFCKLEKKKTFCKSWQLDDFTDREKVFVFFRKKFLGGVAFLVLEKFSSATFYVFVVDELLKKGRSQKEAKESFLYSLFSLRCNDFTEAGE